MWAAVILHTPQIKPQWKFPILLHAEQVKMTCTAGIICHCWHLIDRQLNYNTAVVLAAVATAAPNAK